MNSLGISVLFVLCSVLLSFVKDFVFSDPEPPKSIIKFSKVLELSNNKTQKPSEHYKSLYEAYHKHQFFDPNKMSKLIPNRQEFNQSVLAESFNNQESSFMCGPDFLILVFSGVSVNNLDQVQWVNTLHIYKLPLMTKIKQISMNGKIILPLQCKRNSQMNDLEYEMGMISKEALYLLRIYEDSAYISYTKTRTPHKDQHNIDMFDFIGTWFVYWSQDRPWMVHLENIRIQDETVEVNLLTQTNPQKTSIPQQINVKYLLLGQSEELYLGIVYQHHQYGDSKTNISLLTYLIKDNTSNKIRKRTIDNNIPTHGHAISDCKIYMNQETSKYDLSCLIRETRENTIKYVNYDDVFRPVKQKQNKEENQSKQKEEEKGWVEDYLYSFMIDDDEDDYDYDALADKNQRQAGQQKNYSSFYSMSATLLNPTHELKKIVKHSAPNPILYYQKQQKHYLFSITLPNDISEQTKIESIPYLIFELKPLSSGISEVSLRDIKWVNNQNFVVILWTTGIEVYQYSCTSLPEENGAGISMSVILPFIQLFATVFCILRVVWINE